jgi:Fe-only nitrogenase accessory protein AnfO
MFLKLSVLVRDDQSVAGIEDCCQISVYQLEEGRWSAVHSFQWQLGERSGMSHIRKGIQGLIEQLGDCRIIIGRKITGLPYHVFDKNGFHIFETDRPVSSALMDSIRTELAQTDVEREVLNSALQNIHKAPYSPNNDGIYYLDLTTLQQAFPEISSKKALRQFLEEAQFTELHLICRHIPPWLADAAKARGMHTCLSDQEDGTYKVTIKKGTKTL